MQAALKMHINNRWNDSKDHNPIGVSSMKKLVGPSDTSVPFWNGREFGSRIKYQITQRYRWLTSIVSAYKPLS
jgi:hypothetical protein